MTPPGTIATVTWMAACAITSIPSTIGFVSAFSRIPAGHHRPRQNHRLPITSRHAEEPTDERPPITSPKRVVIIGGGWAGFTAADTLSTTPNLEITLLDAAPRGSGGLAGGWRTSNGYPVESGIHGFWREYTNTFRVMTDRIGLDLEDVLGPYTPSVLVSQSGVVAVAPVLKNDSSGSEKQSNTPSLQSKLADLLPPPLDLALLAELSPASKLTPLDRASGIGLLPAWADFVQNDAESWERYDLLSAEKLFKQYAGVSDALYDEMISPLLHVLPMTPGYDCSAAAALSCFHVFALQSKGAFDVRWCKGGIAESIFNPWVEKLTARRTDEDNSVVDIRGGSRVSSLQSNDDTNKVVLESGEEIECDAIILAVGGTAMSKLTHSSPILSALPQSSKFHNLRGVTCVAVRLFLQPDVITNNLDGGLHGSTRLCPQHARAMKDSPVIVCGAEIGKGTIPELRETGFCIYDLQRMHDEFATTSSSSTSSSDTTGPAVLEVDFFRADEIADLTDDQISEFTLNAVAAALGVPAIPKSRIIDAAVVRARNAVSHFNVGSAACSPNGPRLGDNSNGNKSSGLYVCGDWVDRAGHASWSTEKAVVTGTQAAEAVLQDWGLRNGDGDGDNTSVLPVVEDTVQLQQLRRVAKSLRSTFPPPGEERIPPSPWSFVKNVIEDPSHSRNNSDTHNCN